MSIPTVDPSDRLDAAELLARYAEAIDAGDFAGIGALLSDAVLEDGAGNRIAAGADEIAALYLATTRRHADGTPLTAHVITNVIVEPAGGSVPAARDGDGVGAADGAGEGPELEMRSRFTVFQGNDRLGLQPIAAGRYVDRVRRIDGRWRFVRRRMIPERWGDVADHLTFDPRG
jgi:hypothetical protein